MKKQYAWLLSGALVLSALSGCGEEKPEQILKETLENSQEVESIVGNVAMDMAVDVSESGVAMGVELGLSGDWEIIEDPAAFHFNGEVFFNMLNLSMDVEMYGVEKDGVLELYSKVADQWTYLEQDLEETEELQKQLDTDEAAKDLFTRMTMEEETKKENGKEQYVFHTVLTGEELSKWTADTEALTKEDLEETGLSELDVDVELKIDKEKKLPTGFTLDFNKSLQKILDTAMESLTEADGADVSAEIGKCALVLNFDAFDTIQEIQIPEEAMEANPLDGQALFAGLDQGLVGGMEVSPTEEPEITPAEEPEAEPTEEPEITPEESEVSSADADDDTFVQEEPEEDLNETEDMELEKPEQTEDGSYILEDYDQAVKVAIKTPEGLQEQYMDKHYFGYANSMEDQQNTYINLSYNMQRFGEYYLLEDYIEAFQSQEENAKEYGYASLFCASPKTIQAGDKEITCLTMEYSYDGTDRNRQYCLLVPLDEEYYLQCMISESVFEGDFTLDAGEKLAEQFLGGVTYEGKAVI